VFFVNSGNIKGHKAVVSIDSHGRTNLSGFAVTCRVAAHGIGNIQSRSVEKTKSIRESTMNVFHLSHTLLVKQRSRIFENDTFIPIINQTVLFVQVGIPPIFTFCG